MKIAAYCRVSTDKEDQLNSLEVQKEFFQEYAKRTRDTLIEIYADEGISGTKTKNRREFLRMMRDAEKKKFEMVVVKDISRLARNTVDLLQSIRKLKTLGIETMFLTANMTSMGNSEFVLTIFAALAQEESANISKRVKFGKKMNAKKGRVPNLVFGYDKEPGEYFNLKINESEAEVVKEIFRLYNQEGYGAAKISTILNARGIRTKRGSEFTQTAICRILTNDIYIGRIINGKEEVADFLSGRRIQKEKEEWIVTEKPELRIIDNATYETAQNILQERNKEFYINKERQSNKYLFSTLIKCKNCGWSFRRVTRTYKNTYVYWVCSGRNGKGVDSCSNATRIDEEELMEVLQLYFTNILKKKKNIIKYITSEFQKAYKEKNQNEEREKELKAKLLKINKKRQKYMEMYADDLITKEELNRHLEGTKEEVEKIESELKMIALYYLKGDQLETWIAKTFKEIENITNIHEMTNQQLKRIIQKIEVDENGNVDIILRVLGDLGLDNSVLFSDSSA